MMQVAPAAWYVLATSVSCAIIGILLLANGNVRYFGKRRLELQKEYAVLVKEYAYIREDEKVNSDIHTVEKVPVEEESEEEIEEEIMETDNDSFVSAEEYNLDEFEGESSPLHARSIPSAISKVNKKSVFDLHRELVCKKYKCIDQAVDAETYVLTFAGNNKVLIKWIPEGKNIYIECSANHFDEEFHGLMLDVIKYLGKNMGSKFEITDRFGTNR